MSTPRALKAPFVAFGGKSRVAAEVWRRFGVVKNYVEPFANSAAVLLARPEPIEGAETINDKWGFIPNVWRAIRDKPEEVAAWADNPAHECELHARHAWLIGQEADMVERLEGDPDWSDAKIAGWWLWGAALWIGHGWCAGDGPWRVVTKDGAARLTKDGVARQMPLVGTDGGCMRGLPEIGEREGQGITRQGLFLRDGTKGIAGVARQSMLIGSDKHTGRGVKQHGLQDSASQERKRPHLMTEGKGVNGLGVGKRCNLSETMSGTGSDRGGLSGEAVSVGLLAWFAALSARMKRVRVTCGDWGRIMQPSVILGSLPCAIFLDPPYSHETKSERVSVYAKDCNRIAHDVREWCIANGGNRQLRIALCGYAGEHDALHLEHGWDVFRWKAAGGYGGQNKNKTGRGRMNSERETIWFSPACIPPTHEVLDLF